MQRAGITKKRKYDSGAQKRYKQKIKKEFMGSVFLQHVIAGKNYSNGAELYNIESEEENNTSSSQTQKIDYSVTHNVTSKSIDKFFDINEKSVPALFQKDKFLSEVRKWALKSSINHEQLRGFLSLWNENVPLENLPSDPRTVLCTPRYIDITNGNYWHYGIRRSLNILNHLKSDVMPNEISLRFNMDGLPISKSSSVEAWPILVDVAEIKSVPPCIVGIYCGSTKPQDIVVYLTQFVNDLNDCLINGLVVNNRKIAVKVKCFICDSPARALIKGTVYFNHAHGCQKCTTKGTFNTVGNCMTFKDLNAPRRTDESFRNQVDPLHHKIKSPLLDLPIDMVNDFPVGDALHLLHLGLMKRFLIAWRDGDFGYATKWSAAATKSISSYLIDCKLPAEIHRNMRSLSELCRWKGTELRTFLLYISIVVLKKHLSKFYYEHFLLFYCGIVILNSAYFVKYHMETAHSMINSFLYIFKSKIRSVSFTSNLHNLSHLVDEVKRFGPLSNFDAYPFENRLQQIKKLVRQRKLPLVELAKRVIEQEKVNYSRIKDIKNPSDVSCSKPIKFDCDDFKMYGSTYSVYNKVIVHNFQITNEDNNKWFLTKCYEIVACKCVVSFESTTRKVFLYGSALKHTKNLFEVPVKSSSLLIFAAKREFQAPKMYTFGDIVCKMLKFSHKNCETDSDDSNDVNDPKTVLDSVFIPLWHTLC